MEIRAGTNGVRRANKRTLSASFLSDRLSEVSLDLVAVTAVRLLGGDDDLAVLVVCPNALGSLGSLHFDYLSFYK